jgi:hypothetical protein
MSKIILYILLPLLALTLSACSGGVTETGNPSRSYVTSSSDGYGQWSVNDSSMSGQLNVTAPSTGVVQYTYVVSGGCGAATTYGFLPCTISVAQCTPGATSCAGAPTVGEVFYLLEMPGVALMVYAPAENQLHTGVLLGDCATNLAGDYTTLPNGQGVVNLFGMYRSDASFTNFISSSFAMVTPASPTLYYLTTESGGTGAISIPPSTCSQGVRNFTMEGIPVRGTATAGGLWLFSYPSPLGGSMAFRTELAASLPELANRTFAGFVSADDAATTMARLETGPLAGGQVPYAQLLYQTGTAPPAAGQFLEAPADAPGSFGFNGNPAGAGGTSYATNLLQPTYPTPANIPGLFINPVGSGADDRQILAAMKSNGKLILYGNRFGNRSGTIKITGSVFLFEQ